MKKMKYSNPKTEIVVIESGFVMLPPSPGGEYNPAPARNNMGAIE